LGVQLLLDWLKGRGDRVFPAPKPGPCLVSPVAHQSLDFDKWYRARGARGRLDQEGFHDRIVLERVVCLVVKG
jgi:hypothetical protein